MKNYIKLLLFSFLIIFTTACGSEDLPKPDMNNELFVWYNLQAIPNGQCFTVTGNVNGNLDNIKNISLEVQELTDACVDCPFIAERVEVYEVNKILDKHSGIFSLNYCPLTSAEAYRYRLAGENMITGLPIIYSVPMQVNMNTF